MPSRELTELLDLVAAGRVAMQGRSVGVEEQRARYRKLADMMPMPAGVSVAPVTVGGVPAQRHVPAGGDEGAAVVYLHGGGYCIGSADTHRPMCAHLAAALGCPAAAVLISPWTDVAGGSPSFTSRAEVDPFVFPESLAEMAGWYLGDHDPACPLASPLHADLTGLPPTLIHVGDHERLLDDATAMGERLASAGVDVDVEVWPEMVHVWHFFAGRVPEADQAIAAVAAWLRPRLGLET